MFETQYANLPLPPAFAAELWSYAEFVLPLCLVLGFATRFAALALLIMTALLAALRRAGAVVGRRMPTGLRSCSRSCRLVQARSRSTRFCVPSTGSEQAAVDA